MENHGDAAEVSEVVEAPTDWTTSATSAASPRGGAYASTGSLWGTIDIPMQPANCGFGDADR
jgi:hypothetical protein